MIKFSTKGRIIKIALFIGDIFAVNFAFYIAIIIRFTDKYSFRETGNKYMGMFRQFAPWYTAGCILLFVLFHMYSAAWKYTGFNDLKKLFLVNGCTCMFYIFGSLLIVGRMPISVYILGVGIQFILMCLFRMAPRYILESFPRTRSGSSDGISIPLMIVGLGENARIIQDKIARDRTNIVRPVCVIDHSDSSKGTTFNGLPVFSGKNAVEECVDKFDIRCVIIADDNLPRDYLDNIKSICDGKNIEIRDFVIGTNYTGAVSLRELLEVSTGNVSITGDNGENYYSGDIREALNTIREKRIVTNVSVFESMLRIRVQDSIVAKDDTGEEWIRKYREEMGSDVSFF